MALPAIGSLSATKKINFSLYLGFAIPAAAIIAAGLVLMYVVWPNYRQVVAIRESNKQTDELNTKLEQKVAALGSLDKNKLVNNYSLAEQMLPSDKGVFLLLRELEVTAGTNGVIVNSVSVSPGGVGKTSGTGTAQNAPAAPDTAAASYDASSIKVNLTVTGDYSSVLGFLTSLYTQPRIVSIDNFSVASQESSGALSASFVLNAYWQALPTQLGSIDSPISELSSSEEKRLSKISTSQISVGTSLPQVPLGKSNIFAPF